MKGYKTKTGYKIFRYSDGKLHFLMQQHNRKYVVPIDKWLVTNKKKKANMNFKRGSYMLRFHVYLTRPRINDLNENEIIVRVKFKEPVATGYQDNRACVVASKIIVTKRTFDLAVEADKRRTKIFY